jgi:glucose-1-phosphate adenylyltransferase
MVMAGGVGERLYPLTRDRAKPAVPFGGKYRVIDIVVSNLINSGIHSIYVLTQYKSQSLTEHIIHLQGVWGLFSPFRDHFLMPVPAQKRTGEGWYAGTADSIYQNRHLIETRDPDVVAVFGADHIYRMDIRQMVQAHEQRNADAMVAAIPMPIEQAHLYGVVEVDEDWRVIGFQEKPSNPTPIPGRPDEVLASMGNYLFGADVLLTLLAEDAAMPTAVEQEVIENAVEQLKKTLDLREDRVRDHKTFVEMVRGAITDLTGREMASVERVLDSPDGPCTTHDFGRDILPAMVDRYRLYAYDFSQNRLPGEEGVRENIYWRDVGTIDTYYRASMDLRGIEPAFNIYNPQWPIRTNEHHDPPAKFVHDWVDRVGRAVNSIVCDGSIISGGLVRDSVVGRGVRVHSYAEVTDSILMDGVEVGEGARVQKAIVDKNVAIPRGAQVGFDSEQDHARFPDSIVSEGGITVIPRHRHERRPVTELDLE